MGTTDYCSYELSKALKSCGFNEPCQMYYTHEDDPDGQVWLTGDPRNPENHNGQHDDCPFAIPYCSAPTLWHAQKWLREKKRIFIEVTSEALYDWDFLVLELDEDVNAGLTSAREIYPSYEAALSAGIAAAMELIKEGD